MFFIAYAFKGQVPVFAGYKNDDAQCSGDKISTWLLVITSEI